MTTNPYDKGDLVRVSVAFTDLAGAAVDPTAVTVRVKPPTGTLVVWVYGTDAEVVKDATGAYHADVDIDETGSWYFRWEGTGAAQAAAERLFTVRGSAF